MPLGASHRFVGASDPPNLTDANVNSLDAGANVYQSPNGGLNIRISPATINAFGSIATQYLGEVADVLLAPSLTSFVYVEVASGLLVTGVNTTGFPSTPHVPLAEVVVGGAAIAQINDRRAKISSPPPRTNRQNWIPGAFYGQGDAGGNITNTLPTNTLHAVPWLVGGTMEVDQIACYVVTAGAPGTLARLGLYAEDQANPGYPGTLLEDLGTTAADVIGLRSIALGASRRLDPGLYFVVLVTSSSGQIRAYGQDQARANLGLTANFGGVGNAYTTPLLVGTALPDPFPLAVAAVDVVAPVLALRSA